MVTTIFNKDLTEQDEILTVFKNLHKYRIGFSMIMRKLLPQQGEYFNINFEEVKIKQINEDNTLDLIAYKKGIKTVIRQVPFNDIVEMSATTIKNKVIDYDSSITRFDLLDL